MIKRIGWVGGLLFLIWGTGFSQRIWEGTATVARYGEFPPSGMYGASNSFERNSIVDVENISNGKRARIIITGRVSDPTLFLVVSEQVAAELGIGKMDIARVRVSPVVTPGIDPSLVKPELPLSPDPDINPSARVSKSPLEPAGTPAPTSPPLSSKSSEVPPPIASSQPGAKTEEPVAPPPVSPISPAESPREAESPWKEPDAANPYASLETSVVKRDKSVFSGLSLMLEAEPKEPASASPVPAAPVTDSRGEGPKVAELPLETPKPESKGEILPGGPPVSEGLLRKEPEKPEPEIPPGSTLPETQVQLELVLEPTGPKPPEGLQEKPLPTTSEGARMESTLSFPIRDMKELQRGSTYLQLGRFSRPQSAEGLWERFHRQYPLLVLKEEKGFRVLVGPVKSDERGILYHTFRAFGLKDTFFVKID